MDHNIRKANEDKLQIIHEIYGRNTGKSGKNLENPTIGGGGV
jgi:hypothetical protein